MARNELNSVSVVGYDAPTAEALADKIQTDFIDKHLANHEKYALGIRTQIAFNPPSTGNHGLVIYYVLDERPPQPSLETDENAPQDTKATK